MTSDNGAAMRAGTKFPDLPIYSGFDAPGRIEADIFELEVTGHLPIDLNGAFYRIAPEPQFPPRMGDDVVINGDGLLSMFRFQDGHVDFRSRYVSTEKLRLERAARQSLFGAYRNPFTDEPSVHGFSRGTANTLPLWYGNRLYALKEDSLPVEMDPHTLETIGRSDFEGQITSKTLSAHPKIDPVSGNLCTFGYAAKGETSRDIVYHEIDPYGRVVRTEWFQAPYPVMIHDFVITQDYVIIPIMPATTSEARLRAGHPIWEWDPSLPASIAAFPREAGVDDLRWFALPTCKCYHYFNAFSEGTHITVDGTVADAELFPFFYARGAHFDPVAATPQVRRWTFDFDSPTDPVRVETLWDEYAEFPRIDDRFQSLAHRYGFAIVYDPSRDFGGKGVFGPAMNVVQRYDFASRSVQRFELDSMTTASEPIFVPRDQRAAEAEGWLLVGVNRFATMTNDLLVFDAERLEDGPVATVHLPIRLRNSVHSNWVHGYQLSQFHTR